MKLRGNPNIDVERELSFQNLIVVCSHDAKTLVSFVTCENKLLTHSWKMFFQAVWNFRTRSQQVDLMTEYSMQR